MYNLFSSSPQRWEILKQHLPVSLHGMSKTRWSARVDGVKPVAQHLNSVRNALNELGVLHLTAQAKMELNAIQKYISKFDCILTSSIWIKLLTMIHQTNQIIEARRATLDIEKNDVENLCNDIQRLREQFDKILNESKFVARNIGVSCEFLTNRHFPSQDDAELIYGANFKLDCTPKKLLEEILGLGLSGVFRNIIIALRIFISLPASTASGERTFNVLKQIKSYHRSAMGQERLNGLAMLNINWDIARKLDFSNIIAAFSEQKARKATLYSVRYIQYVIFSTLYSVRYIQYVIFSTLYSVRYIQYVIFSTLYSVFWTEQALESIHQDFNQIRRMRKVKKHSPNYIEGLKNAVVAYNYKQF
ncbi:uncharacterized protein LOC136086215 [Hydra vulgaris]|uniref:uncharacterized protein LOC136086215 n=1 Tax=Hydra vulgaris TaxID=6087 RepID=UPI0032E9DEAD